MCGEGGRSFRDTNPRLAGTLWQTACGSSGNLGDDNVQVQLCAWGGGAHLAITRRVVCRHVGLTCVSAGQLCHWVGARDSSLCERTTSCGSGRNGPADPNEGIRSLPARPGKHGKQCVVTECPIGGAKNRSPRQLLAS